MKTVLAHNVDTEKLNKLLSETYVQCKNGKKFNLLVNSNSVPLPFARYIVLNFARENGMTLYESGTIFLGRSVDTGLKDHSTVCHAIKKYKFLNSQLKQYPEFHELKLCLEPLLKTCLRQQSSVEDVLITRLSELSEVERMVYHSTCLSDFIQAKNFLVRNINQSLSA